MFRRAKAWRERRKEKSRQRGKKSSEESEEHIGAATEIRTLDFCVGSCVVVRDCVEDDWEPGLVTSISEEGVYVKKDGWNDSCKTRHYCCC